LSNDISGVKNGAFIVGQVPVIRPTDSRTVLGILVLCMPIALYKTPPT